MSKSTRFETFEGCLEIMEKEFDVKEIHHRNQHLWRNKPPIFLSGVESCNIMKHKIMRKKENVDFGALVTATMETAKIKPGNVIAESGISRSSFYRAIGAGGKTSKPHVVALVRAINKLAKKVVIDENEALRRAGFDAGLQNPMTIQIETGVQLIVEKSKFSKKRLSILTADLKAAYEMSLLRASTPEGTAPPKKVERKIKVVKKGAQKRRA